MSERFPRLTAAEVERVLAQGGFERVSQSGSHRKWWHPETNRTVIVPVHKGRSLPIGTLGQIVSASGIPATMWCKRR